MVKIRGKVSDFQNNALSGALVLLKDEYFDDVYKTESGSDGEYELDVEEGLYCALAVVKDYGTKYLEYWAWNVPACEALEIDARIDRLEVYAVNAFRPQGAHPSLFIYFRPMSLTRHQDMEEKGLEKDIAPELEESDIEVFINGWRADVLSLNRVREFVGDGATMAAYLVQVSLGDEFHRETYNKVDIYLTDRKTGDRGAACLFYGR